MKHKVVIFGGSAGAFDAACQVFDKLPPNFELPIVLVMHLYQGFNINLSHAFAKIKHFVVCEAEEKTTMEKGHIYVAPPGYHLLFETDESFSLSNDELVNWARPSIDVAFQSAAQVFKNNLIGVILSGANHDGAAGIAAVKEWGGFTLVQLPSSAEMPTMPVAALQATAPDQVLTAADIGAFIANLVESERSLN